MRSFRLVVGAVLIVSALLIEASTGPFALFAPSDFLEEEDSRASREEESATSAKKDETDEKIDSKMTVLLPPENNSTDSNGTNIELLETILLTAKAKPSFFENTHFYSEEELEEAEQVHPRGPQISGDDTEMVIVQKPGENVTLSCSISGFPTPKVVWYEDHERRKTMLEHRMMESEEMDHRILASVFLQAVDCSDEGRYACVAANFLGKAIKKFILEIQRCNV